MHIQVIWKTSVIKTILHRYSVLFTAPGTPKVVQGVSCIMLILLYKHLLFLFFKAWYFNTLKCFYCVQMCTKTQGQTNDILVVNVLVDSQSSSPSQVHFSCWHWASGHLVIPCHQDLYLPSGHPVANVTAVVFKLFYWDWETQFDIQQLAMMKAPP